MPPAPPTAAPHPLHDPTPTAVFLDVDGTLAENGIVPPAHVELLRALRRHGHHVVLSTGRAACIVAPDLLAEVDGAICSAGAHVRLDGELLADHRYPADLARRAVDVLLEAGAPFVLEGPDALWCTEDTAAWMRSRAARPVDRPAGSVGGGPSDLADAAAVVPDLGGTSFAKISLWRSPVPVREIAARIGERVLALPSSLPGPEGDAGELPLRGVDKADGVRLVLDRLGLPLERAVGIGDGMNDLGMLRAVGRPVAITGAPAEVAAAAHLTVAGPREAGLVDAAEQLGLLG